MLRPSNQVFPKVILGLLAIGTLLSAQVRFNSRPALNYGTQSAPYSDQLYAAGGTAPYTFALAVGPNNSLPPGINLNSTGLLSGTPTASGLFTFSLTVTDAANQSVTTSFNIEICPNPFVFSGASSSPIALSAGTVGQLYSPVKTPAFSVTGTCGTFVIDYGIWSLVSGALPAGLRLPYTGLPGGLYGTPTIAGTYNFTLKALEWIPNGRIATQAFTVTIQPVAPLTITNNNAITVSLNSDFQQYLTASGGYIPYTWSTSGPLPPGLILTDGGSLEGQPTQLGTFSFSVTVKDAQGQTATAVVQITVVDQEGLFITTNPVLPAAVLNTAYSKQLGIAGSGGSQVTWSLQSGSSLPPGLNLAPTTGIISGTVAASITPGAYKYTAVAATASQTTSQQQTINVFATALTIVPNPISILYPGVDEIPYFISGNGGVIYGATADFVSGTFPPGLTTANFQEGTGFSLVDGTPDSFSKPSFSAVIRIKTPQGQVATGTITTAVIAPAPMSSTDVPGGILPNLVLGRDYAGVSNNLIMAGDLYFPNSFKVTAGSLPPGITLESDDVNEIIGTPDALLYGTPTATGTYTFTMTGTDPLGGTASGQYTVTVLPYLNTPLQLGPPALPSGTVGISYSQQLTATNGGGPYSYAVSTGSLPPNVNLNPATGLLSGTPTTTGTYSFSIKVTDNTNAEDGGPLTATNAYSVTINPFIPLTITTTSLPSGSAGTAYPGATIAATGGSGGYTFSATGLPTGLSIASTGSITGTPTETGSFTPNFTVTDSASEMAAKMIPLTIASSAPIVFTSPQTLPSGQSGQLYSYQLTWTGGVAPYAVSATGLPGWLKITTSGLLSGTPTAGGAFTFSVTVKDSQTPNQNSATKSFTIVVSPPSITTTSPLPAATTNVPYSDTFMASGGAGGYKWTAQGLPGWLSLSSAGALTGTPPAGVTSVSFSVTVTDSLGAYSTGSFTLPVMAPPLMFITTSPLPPATAGVLYSDTFMATGGAGGYTFTATGLPTWLTLASGGALTGTPPQAGPVTFTVTVHDSAANMASQMFTLPVNTVLSITTTSPLTPATVGALYSNTLMASGGTGGYTWTATGLPGWLSLSAGGAFSGTPATAGPVTFNVTVHDSSSNMASMMFTLPVDAALKIGNTSPLPAATVGVGYMDTFTASGGSGTYTWSATGLPSTFSLSSAGVLIGNTSTATPITFSVTVTDTLSNKLTEMFTLPVNAVLTITNTSPLPAATSLIAYSDNFTASGGSGGYSWSATGLPSWLTLTAAGFLTGTPPAGVASATFSVTVTDSAHNTAQGNFTLPVNAALTINNTSPLPAATIGTLYSANFSASGGSGGYTWSATGLPAWLTLTAAGLLSGTPPAGVASVSFSATVTDSSHDTASANFTLPVNAALTINNLSPLAAATVGTLYSANFTASGGSGGYTWTATGLPAWLTLTAAGFLSGTPPAGVTSVSFTVKVTDSSNDTAQGNFTLPVNSALTINNTSPLPAATVGTLYSANFTASGGSGGFTWTATGLPSWLTLTAAGFLSGTPPAGVTSVSFTVKVTDSSHDTAQGTFTLPVNSALTINTTSPLPAASVGILYSANFTASGGSGGYTWAATGLPSWLALTSAGSLSGTPPAGVTSVSFAVTVTDSSHNTANGNFTLPVNAPLLITTASPLPSATAGVSYSETFTASGGMPGYKWTAVGLPNWLGLSSAGVLTGTPPSGVTPVSFTVTVTDSLGVFSTRNFTLPVAAALMFITTSPLPPATTNLLYSDTFMATGGAGGYTFTATGLPTWLTLASGGALTGTPPQAGPVTFMVTVHDSSANTASQMFTLPVNSVLSITTTSPLTPATVGALYSSTLMASGGTGGYTWTATGLPSWLSLSAGGVFSGTPTTAGPVTFNVTVHDSSSNMASMMFTLPVDAALKIGNTSPLPAATVGVGYMDTFTASGGSGTYTWSATGLPSTFSLSSAGVLIGNTSTATPITFSVTVTDTLSNKLTEMFTLPVNAVLTITNTSPLPVATSLIAYSDNFTASGGSGGYTWFATGLPSWLTLTAAGFLTGTPPAGVASATFSVTVTDSSQHSVTENFTLPVNSTLTITNTSPLPAATIGTLYSANFSASGGSGGYTWTSTGLPSWLTLTAAGLLSGTPPTGLTSVSFSVTVTDSSHDTANRNFTLPVNAGLTINNTSPLPAATTATLYSANFSASGGSGGYTWTATGLPSWLTMTAAGFLSGTPPAGATSVTFSVTVTDSSHDTAQGTFTLPVNSALTINNTSPLPAATIGTAYSANFTASGGSGGYTWTATGLPSWLTLTAAGFMSGTPPPGAASVSFSVTLTDSSHDTAQGNFTLAVEAALTINNTSPLAAATAASPYSLQFTATGGTSTYTWTASQLPTWLTLSSAGLLTGTPPAAGSVSFTVTVTDSASNHTSLTFTLPVNPVQMMTPLAITTTSPLVAATATSLYSLQFAATGGTGTYTWSASQLPTWLSLSTNGLLTGTPPAAGPVSFTITVTDIASNKASVTFTLPVNPSQGNTLLGITNSSILPSATAGSLYSERFTATGGTGNYTWSATQLPAGLALSSGGLLTGTPPTAGSVSFTVTVADSGSHHASATFTLPVNPAQVNTTLAITNTSPLPSATAGSLYSLQLTASGGTGPYTWTGSGLPNYLSLSAGGLLTGTPPVPVSASFMVTVTDSSARKASQTFTLNVYAPQFSTLTVATNSPLPGAAVGIRYSVTLAATGGNGGYTWTGANLPAGLTLSSSGVLSGIPTTAGPTSFSVSVTDGSGVAVSKTLSLLISSSNTPLQFTTTALPSCSIDSLCSAAFGATGGVPPYSFSLNQTQPIGDNLTLSPQGLISGTPTQAETVSFSVQVTDSAKNTISQAFSIQVNANTLSITSTSTSLPPGSVNNAYSATLQTTGGGPAYSWTIVSGSLPPGLSLNASSGAITGTPISAGSSTFSVQVSSGTLTSAPVTFTIVITSLAPLTVTSPLQLPPGDLGASYSQNLSAIGGTGGYTWKITAGSLPAGLSLSTTGAITGTPSTAQTATFTATVTDSSGNTAIVPFTLNVMNPAVPNILTSSPLPDGVVNQPYDYSISVSGGTPPYTWSIAQGMIPDGLTFNSANGTFSGTPTTPGIFTFNVTVSDSSTASSAAGIASARLTAPAPRINTATKTYTIHIVAVSAFHIAITSPLPNASVNAAYSDSLAAAGGTAPYRWQLVNGSWPPGIGMDSAGNVTGTPTTMGTYSVTVQATDSAGLVATAGFSLTVANPGIPFIATTPAPANGTVNVPYSQVLPGSGGTAPYKWAIITGSLPPGLRLDPDTGTIFGTPTQKGSYPFTVQVTDRNGLQASQQFTITIYASDLTITTAALPNAFVNVPYSNGIAVTGGSSPYTWSLSAGSLVSGFRIDPATGILSGTPAQSGTLHFTISVTDQIFDQTSQAFDLTVESAPLTITTTQTTLTATVGTSYSFTFTAAQGTVPYKWSVNGTLPPGISLNSQTGVLTGTPTTSGTSTFTVQVSDATGAVAQVLVTMVVKPAALAISTGSTLPAGTAGSPYSQTFSAMGGTGAITWKAGSGTPPGLSLASATGILSGTPTMAGDFSFSIEATDSAGITVSQTYQLHIAGPAALMATVSGLPATVNPGDQPTVNLTLASGLALPITLTATLQLSPSLGANTDLLFANGSRTMQFTIPANTTQYSFSFQAGTLAGTIQLGLAFQAAGADITPSPSPVLSTQIVAAAPAIKSIVVTQVPSGIQVVMDGLSTTRDMKTATFQFTAAPGATLQTTSVTVDVTAMFAAWYQSASSLALGSQFSLTIPFTIGGSVNSIASVSATLTNSVGTSAAVSASVP